MGDLAGKIVLITGASRGIGAETARQVVAADGKVILHYNKNESLVNGLIDELGKDSCCAISADFMKNSDIQDLWKKSLDWSGRVDILVNNAGIYESIDIDSDFDSWALAWERTMQVNLLASVHLSREAIRSFLKSNGGAIINVTSRAAFRGDSQQHLHYAASKGGQISITHTIARGWGKKGVMCYSVAPGWVDTEMAREGAEQIGWDNVMRDLPLEELVPPKEVADVIVFLSSGKARHATGSSVNINGASFPR